MQKKVEELITIIIPTYNRSHYLARILQYYKEQNTNIPILVADSSSKTESRANLAVVDSVSKNLKVELKYFETNESWLASSAFYGKVISALMYCESKFVVLCADDDFIVPDAIRKCTQFLEENPDYSIAHGRSARVFYLEKQRNFDSDLLSVTFGQRTIENNDPCLRLQDHLNGYAPTFYSVHRRADLLSNFQNMISNTSNYHFGELLLSCLSIIQGKSKCLDLLYMVRQSIVGSTGASVPRWSATLAADDFEKQYAKFSDCLLAEVAASDKSSPTQFSSSEFRSIIDDSFHNFATHMLRNKSKRPYKEFFVRVYLIIKLFPSILSALFNHEKRRDLIESPKQTLRRVKYKNNTNIRHDPMSLYHLLNAEYVYHKDFFPIYESLMRHPFGISHR